MYKRQVAAPALVGKSIAQALSAASNCGLTLRCSAVQIRADSIPGIVIDQTPQAGVCVNVPQVISVTVSERPVVPQVPNLIGKKESELKLWAIDSAAQLEIIPIKSMYPAEHCCAQFPAAGSHVAGARVKSYMAVAATSHLVMPDLMGKPVQEVRDACGVNGFSLTLFHQDTALGDDHVCGSCVVLDQRPAAGTVVSKNFLRSVHVQAG